MRVAGPTAARIRPISVIFFLGVSESPWFPPQRTSRGWQLRIPVPVHLDNTPSRYHERARIVRMRQPCGRHAGLARRHSLR